MVRTKKHHRAGGLLAGNHCHDVHIKDGVVVAETLGGAASFISAVLDGLSLTFSVVSKVGQDFAYSAATTPRRRPIVVSDSLTTLFHAYFDAGGESEGRGDRVLRRVRACAPILPSDLPDSRFDFGMVVGVGGEIGPETAERVIECCDAVFVDVQSLIRVFGGQDGTVNLVGLKESGFFHLLPRIGFLKASREEASALDLDEARKLCCVVVTDGKRGCGIYWADGHVEVGPFPTVQVDPTGAGDCFLGGFAAGIVQGLSVPDAALVGNLFGSMAVGQVGVPSFDPGLLQRVKDEIQRRKIQCSNSYNSYEGNLKFTKPAGFEQFYASLAAAKVIPAIEECQWDRPISPAGMVD